MLLFDAGKKLEKAFTAEQFNALVEALEKRDGNAATKEDLRETELRERIELEKLRSELKTNIEELRSELKTDIEELRSELKTDIEKQRAELKTDIEKLRTELKSDIAKSKYDLLKWQIGLAIAIIAIMAKGFGWLGF